MNRNRERSWIGDGLTVAGIFGLLLAVYFLPPDTSLAEIERAGVLRVCVPPEYPPLVTRDQAKPGFDIELITEIARRMDVRLAINPNQAISRNFNVRNWGVTRGQCQVLAGGVVASETTRSFLDTATPYLDTGWAIVGPDLPATLEGVTIGSYAGLAGLDRTGLGNFVRANRARLAVVDSPSALAEGIRSGTLAVGIGEALAVQQVASANGWEIAWLPPSIGRYPITFGLWKGDLTLKRKISAILADLEREGFLAALTEKYAITPIAETYSPSPPPA